MTWTEVDVVRRLARMSYKVVEADGRFQVWKAFDDGGGNFEPDRLVGVWGSLRAAAADLELLGWPWDYDEAVEAAAKMVHTMVFKQGWTTDNDDVNSAVGALTRLRVATRWMR